MSIGRDESHRATIVAGFVQSSVERLRGESPTVGILAEPTNTVYANCAFDRRSGRSPERPETSCSRAIR